MVFILGIATMKFTSASLLRRRSWWQHLPVIQKSLTLFQIMFVSAMDVAPLLYINRVAERSSLLLPYGLLLSVPAISTISTVPVISMISHVDFLIVLLLLRGPLAM
jgi:hypothetical protein